MSRNTWGVTEVEAFLFNPAHETLDNRHNMWNPFRKSGLYQMCGHVHTHAPLPDVHVAVLPRLQRLSPEDVKDRRMDIGLCRLYLGITIFHVQRIKRAHLFHSSTELSQRTIDLNLR